MGVELSKKPKDLSASEREERGYGEGVSTENVNESALCTTYDVVCSRKAARHLVRSTAFAILPGRLHARPWLAITALLVVFGTLRRVSNDFSIFTLSHNSK